MGGSAVAFFPWQESRETWNTLMTSFLLIKIDSPVFLESVFVLLIFLYKRKVVEYTWVEIKVEEGLTWRMRIGIDESFYRLLGVLQSIPSLEKVIDRWRQYHEVPIFLDAWKKETIFAQDIQYISKMLLKSYENLTRCWWDQGILSTILLEDRYNRSWSS